MFFCETYITLYLSLYFKGKTFISTDVIYENVCVWEREEKNFKVCTFAEQ